jgi:hypothetical protein
MAYRTFQEFINIPAVFAFGDGGKDRIQFLEVLIHYRWSVFGTDVDRIGGKKTFFQHFLGDECLVL